MSPLKDHEPCNTVTTLKAQVWVGASVSAFFVSLFFIYVMSFFSQIDQMNISLVKIQEQLASLVENVKRSTLSMEKQASMTDHLKDRVVKIEAKLEEK